MENSKIEWTDHTFNPWKICTPVSPGCLNCYAAAMSKRYGWGEYKKGVPRKRNGEAYWKFPLQWNRKVDTAKRLCISCGKQFEASWRRDEPIIKCSCGADAIIPRPRVFCASLSDWLDDEAPIEWLAELLKLIHDTPNLDWLLLTKRPENWEDRLKAAWDYMHEDRRYDGPFRQWMLDWAWNRKAPANIWLGATVENQAMADKRIPELLQIPARVRFLSCEPVLEPIELRKRPHGGTAMCRACAKVNAYPKVGWPTCECGNSGRDSHRGFYAIESIDWLICGGESGHKRRPFNADWARSLRDQCASASVPFFMKQMDKVQEIPADLLIRQFPQLQISK